MNVLVTDRFDAKALAELRKSTTVSQASSPDLAAADLSQVEALVIRSRTKIDGALLARAPQLRLVVTSTSGFDHIDLDACVARDVKVMYTPEANAASAAELTWALVLAAARKIEAATRAARSGDWNRDALLGVQLSGKTYGVIGRGRIGSRVANMAHAFGMQVIWYDPYRPGPASSLEEIFEQADVFSAHVPATRETDGMIKTFEACRSGAIFVNTSRGSIVREATLVDALENDFLACVGLDVFEREPLPSTSKLLTNPRVVMTPHVGATTHEAFAQASMEAAEKVIAFAQHGALSDELPGNEPWMQHRA